MRLTFFGSAGEVGRSCILVESRNAKILLDSGIKLGEQEEHPLIEDGALKGIDAMILTHAHLDHCGYIPHLYSNGYNGSVYATKPTLELTDVIINDYMEISRPRDVTKAGVQKMPRHHRITEYHQEFKVKDITAKLLPAGHILGSAMIELTDGKNRLIYTGDINLKTTRLLDPAYTERLSADTLITECTYGGKLDIFPSERTVLGAMVASLKETINKGGKIIIPSFAVGRAQEVLFILDDYIRSGVLPKVPIYVDGMIRKAMRIYRHNVIYCRDEIQKRILMSEDDPFKSKNFNNIQGRQQRSRVIKSEGAGIIVTTSGMLKGGPVIGYLEKLSSNPNNKLILVGYQAVGTPGRALEDGAREMKFDGKEIDIKMKVERYRLSAHADRPQLLKLVDRVNGLKRVFVAHGEESKLRDMYDTLKGRYDTKIAVHTKAYEL